MDATLERRLKLTMLFRLVMVTTLLLVAVYVEAVSEYLLPVNPLYYVIGATYGITVLHALALRFLARPVLLVYGQVIADLLIISALVYVVGGVRPGFVVLYPIAVLYGSVLLLRPVGGFSLAGLATVLYAAVLWSVWSGLVPPQGLSDLSFMPLKALLYSVLLTAVSCGTVALIGGWLSTNLQRVGEKLERATDQVANLQELNEVIVNSIHSGLITAAPDGRIRYANVFAESILDKRVADLVGRRLEDVLASRLVESAALKVRSADSGMARFDLAYQTPAGKRLSLGVSIWPLLTSELGGGYLVVFQDLTDIKQLEGQVRFKEKLAAVGEMAAQLAHEIRNPLGSISGSAQLLLSESTISSDQRRLLEIITRESTRLSETLNQFLHQSRPVPTPTEPVDIGPVLAEAVTLLRNSPEVGEAREVRFVADEGPHLCKANADQIVQVFWNIARNGLEAMPDGGVLSVRLKRSAQEVQLLVTDQGRGLASDARSQLFEPFSSGRPMGVGLGLAIVYRIVREHRGDISLRNLAGEGTEVEVRLPLVTESVPA